MPSTTPTATRSRTTRARVEWRVDGKLVRTEFDVPFGDDASFWPSTSVANGTHTFEVRAVNGSGTVLAKNTVTATVANTTSTAGARRARSPRRSRTVRR